MYKIRKSEKGYEIFDGFNFFDRIKLSQTSWEIVKLLKKYPKEQAVKKIMEKFNIDRQNAEEDIKTILENFDILQLKLEDIPSTVSNVKYAPRTVHFDISTKCNSECIYCLAHDRMKNNKELSTQQIIRIINQMPDLGTWLLCLSGGEPFLRKDIFEILNHVENLHLLTQVYTNGMLITDDIAKKISKLKYVFLQVSLDSCVPENHDKNRGQGTHKKALNGIRNLLKNNLTPEIAMILTKYNYKDLEKTAEFLHNLGIKYIRIGPAVPYCGKGFENKNNICLKVKEYKEVGKKIIELSEKYKGSLTFLPTREFVVFTIDYKSLGKISKCGNSRQVLYIGSEGLVYPCIFLVAPKFVIGDAKKEKLRDIWKNSTLTKKIRYLSVEDIDKCKTCEYNHLCSGGCRASAYYHFGSAFAHDPYFCALFKKNNDG